MPRIAKTKGTKEKLLEQGLTSFLRSGYNGTGLKEVLDTVGVPKGSFYNYFQSKEDYAAQVLELFDQRLQHAWNNAWASHEGDVLDGIRGIYQALIRYYDNNQYRDGCLIGNLTSEVGDTHEGLRDLLRSKTEGWKNRMADQLREGQARGEVRGDIDAESLSCFFWDAWEGSLLRMKVEQSTAPLSRTLTFLLDDFFRPRG